MGSARWGYLYSLLSGAFDHRSLYLRPPKEGIAGSPLWGFTEKCKKGCTVCVMHLGCGGDVFDRCVCVCVQSGFEEMRMM